MMRSICSVIAVAGLVSLAGFTSGCSGPTEKSYIPSADLARDALELTLEEWKAGKEFGVLKGIAVPVEVYDSRWQKGKKLESYEIVSEEKGEGPKTFIVKMKLVGDKEDSEVKYLVVGKNPLLVFTEKEYNKASGIGGGSG